MRWDHGCQFLRADTPQFQTTIQQWIEHGWAIEYNPRLLDRSCSTADFFGMGGGGCGGPFYVGVGGMRPLIHSILEDLEIRTKVVEEEEDARESVGIVRVFRGTRVAQIKQKQNQYNNTTNHENTPPPKWILHGVDGAAAFHDTSEQIASATPTNILGADVVATNAGGYDAVILTDLSSSFGGWHRASAGVPAAFAERVRTRAGARVPLFAVMIAFEGKMPVPFDALPFGEGEDGGGGGGNGLWFAGRTSSKPGMVDDDNNNNNNDKGTTAASVVDCWTLISTPEYALQEITETPMQAKDGTFLPQTHDVLSVCAADLERIFRQTIVSDTALTGGQTIGLNDLPKTRYRDAQRWGSALRAHPRRPRPSVDGQVDTSTNSATTTTATTEREVKGVLYDSRRDVLGPTTKLTHNHDCKEDDDEKSNTTTTTTTTASSFIADPSGAMLFQAGDMVSGYTPGAEGAALSGLDCGSYVRAALINSVLD